MESMQRNLEEIIDLTQDSSEEVASNDVHLDLDTDRYGNHHDLYALTTDAFAFRGATTALSQIQQFLAPGPHLPEQSINSEPPRANAASSSSYLSVNIVQPFQNIEKEVVHRGFYDRHTIARDVLVTIGTHLSLPALNSHLLPLCRLGWIDESANLSTLRWDIVEQTRPAPQVSMPPAIEDEEEWNNVAKNLLVPNPLNSNNQNRLSLGQSRPNPLIGETQVHLHPHPRAIISSESFLGLGQNQLNPLIAQSPSHTVNRGLDSDQNPFAGHAHPANPHGGSLGLDHSRPNPLAAQSPPLVSSTIQKTITPDTAPQPEVIKPHVIQKHWKFSSRTFVPENGSFRRSFTLDKTNTGSEDIRPSMSNASTSRPLLYPDRTIPDANTGVSSLRQGWPPLSKPIPTVLPTHNHLASNTSTSIPSPRRGRPPLNKPILPNHNHLASTTSTSIPSPRRGRPPLNKPILPNHNHLASTTSTDTPSPRRGRPRKTAVSIDLTRSSTEEESSKPVEFIETPVNDGIETSLTKKRGGSFKNSRSALGDGEPSKKRGRPAKKPEAVITSSEPKKRGRPFKHPEAANEVPVSEPKFNAFICEWNDCPAELHNLETLRAHIFTVHSRKQPLGVFPCLWANCSSIDEMMDEDTLSPNVVDKHFEFKTKDEFQNHVNKAHLVSLAWHMGDGPRGTSLGTQKSDSETSYSWLNDAMGNQVTPSVKNQPIEDGRARENNARRFEKKLDGIFVVLTPKKPAEGTYTLHDEVDEDEVGVETGGECFD